MNDATPEGRGNAPVVPPLWSRRIRSAWIAAAGGLAALALAAVLFSGCCCVPRHPVLSARVLADIAAQEAPSALKESTAAPEASRITYSIRGKPHAGFLYVPADGARAGVVLAPGAAEKGAEDPRLVAFARTLARAQFAVLVPDIADMREFNLGTNNVHEMADALRFMASRPDLSPGGRLGIVAMSYAAGPAILAALQPDLRDEVRFIVSVGGYYDLVNVVTFFTTGYFRHPAPGSPWQWIAPNAYGKWAFALTNVDRLENPSDRQWLREIAERKLDDPDALVEPLAARLGPEGRAYFALLTNRDPARVPQLIEALPQGLLAEFHALNLARANLSALEARVLLFHGRGDNIIPYTESVRLARAIGEDRLFLVDGLQHVDVEDIGVADRLKLWCGVDALLSQRSR